MQLYHLTLNTGHVRRSPLEEFEATIPTVQGWIQTATLRDVGAPEPLEAFNLGDGLSDYQVVLSGLHSQDLDRPGGGVHFSLHEGMSPLIVGTACWDPKDSKVAWDRLVLTYNDLFPVPPRMSCPTEFPWLAVIITPVIDDVMCPPWVGGFEANLAFALMRELGGFSTVRQKGGCYGMGSMRNVNSTRRR